MISLYQKTSGREAPNVYGTLLGEIRVQGWVFKVDLQGGIKTG